MNEIERGRRLMRAFLNSKNKTLDVRTRNRLFSLFDEFYIADMMYNPKYYEIVSGLLNRRKTAAEKEALCYNMVQRIMKHYDMEAEYEKRWPGDLA